MELLINTAQHEIQVAIANQGDVVVSDTWEANRQLTEILMPRICDMLKKCRISFSDVRAIRVHAGPGNGTSGFTTLRIGVIAANTLAYALRVPLYAVEGKGMSLSELVEANTKQVERVIPSYAGPPDIGSVPM